MSRRLPGVAPVLPGVRDGDLNIDWREVAEKLLIQNQDLVRQLEAREFDLSDIDWHPFDAPQDVYPPPFPETRLPVVTITVTSDTWELK